MEDFIKLEENMNLCKNLIEITKGYCEHYVEKSKEVSVLFGIMEILLNKQQECINLLDKTYLNSDKITTPVRQ